jgi:hypothetical protein
VNEGGCCVCSVESEQYVPTAAYQTLALAASAQSGSCACRTDAGSACSYDPILAGFLGEMLLRTWFKLCTASPIGLRATLLIRRTSGLTSVPCTVTGSGRNVTIPFLGLDSQ